MSDSIAGVVLAAGAGSRLAPLTDLLPKPLCPVGDRPMVLHQVAAVGAVVEEVAVNVHHGREAMLAHLGGLTAAGAAVHISVEEPVVLGTAGAIGALRRWLAGRGVLVVNADCWHRADLAGFVGSVGPDRAAVLTTTPGAFGATSTVVASWIPASAAAALPATPSGLWEVLWGPAIAEGTIDTVHTDAVAIDCGTPAGYLAANLDWSGGVSVLGEGAVVEGTVERCVVWPGSRVGPDEHLVEVIRARHLTVRPS